MKRIRRLFCLFGAIILLLNSISTNTQIVSAKEKDSTQTAKYVANYIKKNVKKFAKAYNKTVSKSSEKFRATKVDRQIKVKIVDDNTSGIYLDFNKNNGYMVIAENGEVIDFKVKGNLSYLHKKKTIYYSQTDGFVYFDKKKNMITYKRGVVTEKKWREAIGKTTDYDGTNNGIITDADKYVADRYGSKYSLAKEKSLKKNYPYKDQYNNSVYYRIKDGLAYSESNCTLNSIYTALGYLKKAKKKFKSFPSVNKNIKFDATTDSFYHKFSKDSNYDIRTPKKLPVLYCDIRQYAVDKGYYNIKGGFFTIKGTQTFKITNIIKGVGKKYNIEMKPKQVLLFSFKNQVKKEIDAGYPTLFNMADHPVYKNHSVVVTGYREYTKKKKILFFTVTEKVQIMKISDNWNETAVYLDYDAYNGLGSFIKIR